MQYTSGKIGRTFVARLEDGDPVYESIESLAIKEGVGCGLVLIIGGVTDGGVVVGPEDRESRPPIPVVKAFDDAREILGVGMLFENAEKKPKLHMHAAMGKGDTPLVGCPREGLKCWLVNEVVILEMSDMNAMRKIDAASGFELLECGAGPA